MRATAVRFADQHASKRLSLLCRTGKGKYGTFLADISEFYCDFHHKCYGKHLVYMHDPVAMLAVVRKDLFEWEKGPALVAVDGPMRGKTLVDCAPPPSHLMHWVSGYRHR